MSQEGCDVVELRGGARKARDLRYRGFADHESDEHPLQ